MKAFGSFGSFGGNTYRYNRNWFSLVVTGVLLSTCCEVVIGHRGVHGTEDDRLSCSFRWGCGTAKYCSYNNPTNKSTSRCEECPSSVEECTKLSLHDLGVADCLNRCNYAVEGDYCDLNRGESMHTFCAPGRFYCDFAKGDNGTCVQCPSNFNPSDCLAVSENEWAQESCLECQLHCTPVFDLEVDGEHMHSNGMWSSPVTSASGPLVNCSNLNHDDQETCPDAENSICLVEDHRDLYLLYDVVSRCEKSGGVGVLLFRSQAVVGTNQAEKTDILSSWLGHVGATIPIAAISLSDGTYLLQEKLGSNTIMDYLGSQCWQDQTCSDTIPCIASEANSFCGNDGLCYECPKNDETDEFDPFQCFFNEEGKFTLVDQHEVETCASTCGTTRLSFGDCKFCPQDISSLEFGVDRESDRCRFCWEDDVQYPEREVRLFGNSAHNSLQCKQLQEFFDTVEVHKDSQNCLIAQTFNYICGCTGPGYGGASSHAKKVALVWLPRAMALLSLMGSSFVIWHATATRTRRKQIVNQLLVSLSAFDILGSSAYALTSLPIPATDYIHGSKGNEASCTAQGFFIQVGTISCYTNVSLAIYYLLVIRFGWSKRKVKQRRTRLLLPPVLIGLTFAFAGLPYYDNMFLWCNNSERWWPDILVAVAIFAATIIMAVVCWHVYQMEKGSGRWRSGGVEDSAENRLSTQVAWQAAWYLMAFYLTWPPYLALQYSWASGRAFWNYGLVLTAGTMAPLQGFWNFLFYLRRNWQQPQRPQPPKPERTWPQLSG